MHKDLFNDLEKDLDHSLDQDLLAFRKEITGLLEDEIVSRYFYEAGSIELTLKTDEQVLKAIEILNNKPMYDSILQGKSGSTLITSGDDQPVPVSVSENTGFDQAPV
jgi:carboxyl-terminal processing protease